MSTKAHHVDHDGSSHGTLKSYMTGFVLSVILTVITFWLVMNHVMDKISTSILVVSCAVVQIVVHMVYFLHMNSKSENGWTLMALIFTVILVFITLIGSLWVMYHMNRNMMPQPGLM